MYKHSWVKKVLIFLVVVSLYYTQNTIFAGNENNPIGARSSGMGNASVTHTDFWSVHNNQAGMTNLKMLSAGIYFENKYLLKELSLKSAAIVMPTSSGVFGLTMNYFGYSAYNETKIGLAYAKQLGKKLSAGVQLDYLSTRIAENYGNRNMLTFEVGLLSQINDKFSIGVHVFNPVRAKLSEYNDERTATVIKLGASWTFSKKIILCAEAEKDINLDPIYKTGLEYHIIEPIYVRMGIATNPLVNTFGFGMNFNKLKIDFASSVHSVLGYTPQFSLIYNFK